MRAAVSVRELLRSTCKAKELAGNDVEILGPAPAPVLKVNNRYRYRIVLIGRNDAALRRWISWLLKEFANDRGNRGVNIFVDCNMMD